ncbi:MAG TPA: RES family NAD+ phosphorylase [Thermoanaerobaculia bacterium]|jgi:RES domain-containing protein
MLPRTGGRTIWRITSARFGGRAYDGEGARLYGGRWNQPGTAVAYGSWTLSLAAMECFVHLEPDLAPPDLVAVAADLPARLALETLEVETLPGNWRSYPAPEPLRDLGTDWVRSARSVILQVPSVVIPHEMNVLINPAHPDFSKLQIRHPEPFSFDPRMW